MYTLNENYTKNINIMEENLNRGMSYSMAMSIIDSQKKALIKAGLYGEEEQHYIKKLEAVVLSHKSKIDIVIN